MSISTEAEHETSDADVRLDADVTDNMKLIGSVDIKTHAHISLRLCIPLVCHNFSCFFLFFVLILHVVTISKGCN